MYDLQAFENAGSKLYVLDRSLLIDKFTRVLQISYQVVVPSIEVVSSICL